MRAFLTVKVRPFIIRIKGCIALVHDVRANITEHAVYVYTRVYNEEKISCLKKKNEIFDYQVITYNDNLLMYY